MGTSTRDKAISLFQDFCIYYLQIATVQKLRDQGKFVGKHKLTEERIQLFEELIAWCAERHIDPRLWVYLLYRNRCWAWPIPMSSAKAARPHLLSEKAIAKYDKFMEQDRLDSYESYRRRSDAKRKSPFDPNVDVIPIVEAKKERYVRLGQTQACIQEMRATTFGFHPRSRICSQCPAQMSCRQQLLATVSFDILGLREGRITVEEAKHQVRGGTA